MTILTLDAARAHLRVEPDYPADQVQPYLDAAEDAAQRFLNRCIYADDAALAAAQAAAPGEVAAAVHALTAARTAAQAMQESEARAFAFRMAERTYLAALAAQHRAQSGIVITPAITAAILLLLAHLYEHREDVARANMAALPRGAEHLLFPYRVRMGI